jgi:hypothetical protein
MNFRQSLNAFALVAVLLVALCVPAFTAGAVADSFDTPLKKEIVDLGLSPDFPSEVRVHIKLSCYFFPSFLVQQYDSGQKGADRLEIVLRVEGVTPACASIHAAGERVIRVEWSGYFRGAKGNLVFFYASDGTNGGMPFIVYDSRTGSKIFQDTTFDSTWLHNKVAVSTFSRPRVSIAPDGQVSLKYLRVVETDCDLHLERASCWEQTRKKLALKSAQMPICNGYKGIPTRWSSAVAYPVEVLLFPQPVSRTIAGPIECWPVD